MEKKDKVVICEIVLIAVVVVSMLVLVLTLGDFCDKERNWPYDYPSGSISGKLIDAESSGYKSVRIMFEDKKPITLYSDVGTINPGDFLMFCENNIGGTLLIDYTYKETADCYYLIDYSII